MPVQPVVFTMGSSELRGEPSEEIPFTPGQSGASWPPPGFCLTSDSAVTTTNNNTASQLPSDFNLEWVQGDTAEFQFIFTDVLWTLEDPEIDDETAPVWEQREWAAQVRNPYIFSTYTADYWVPAYGFQYRWWRGHSIVGLFDTLAEAIEIPDTDPQQWGTKVTLTLSAAHSADILPGNWFRWDLQTRTVDDAVRTYLRGRARIITEWTVA